MQSFPASRDVLGEIQLADDAQGCVDASYTGYEVLVLCGDVLSVHLSA